MQTRMFSEKLAKVIDTVEARACSPHLHIALHLVSQPYVASLTDGVQCVGVWKCLCILGHPKDGSKHRNELLISDEWGFLCHENECLQSTTSTDYGSRSELSNLLFQLRHSPILENWQIDNLKNYPVPQRPQEHFDYVQHILQQ